MNAPQIHLMLNHLPVLGVVFATAALSAGLWWRRGSLMRFGLFTVVAASIAVLPVYFSGGPSEDAIERLAGVQRPMIEQHEDAAGLATAGLGVLGIGALLTLIRYRKRTMPAPAVASVLAGALVLAAVLAWTAHLGGRIRHAELNDGASAASTSAEAAMSEHE